MPVAASADAFALVVVIMPGTATPSMVPPAILPAACVRLSPLRMDSRMVSMKLFLKSALCLDHHTDGLLPLTSVPLTRAAIVAGSSLFPLNRTMPAICASPESYCDDRQPRHTCDDHECSPRKHEELEHQATCFRCSAIMISRSVSRYSFLSNSSADNSRRS